MPISTETKENAAIAVLSTWASMLIIALFAISDSPAGRELAVAGIILLAVTPIHWISFFKSALRDILLAINEVQDTGADESTTTHQPA